MKIGDVVVVIDVWGHGFSIGTKGEVVDFDEGIPVIKSYSHNYTQILNEDQLEIYEEPPEAGAVIQVTNEEFTTTLATQIGGSHYQLPIQPIDYIVKNDLGYREGNVVKYVTRHKTKNGAEDIKKAIHYLEMILEDYKSTRTPDSKGE